MSGGKHKSSFLNVQRHELKYFINSVEYHSLVNRLKHGLKADQHSTPHKGYFIRSLYFDSYDNECLSEKLAGIMFRKKYRIRTYSINTDVVKFEIKNKYNNQIHKESAQISKESANQIIACNYEEMLKYNNPVLNKSYVTFKKKLYKPKVTLEYYRDAFIFNNFQIRITIDKDLRSNSTCFDFFSGDFHSFPNVLEGKHILEIKYNTVLPEFIRNIIQLDSCERSAISKYTIARRFFKINNWEDM